MTWREISISGKPYLVKYVNDINDEISFYASDIATLWKEKCSVVDVVKRVREQNERVGYGNDVIFKTLAGTPTDAKLKLDHLDESGKLELKFYVGIKQIPFHFGWFLKKCEQEEYMDIILTPLLLSTLSLAKQNAELIDTVKKKDLEIEQYKLEGATLKRNKLITEKFDETEFKHKICFKPIDEFIAFADGKFKDSIQQYHEPNHQKAGSSNDASPEKKPRYLTKSSPKGKKSPHYRSHVLRMKNLDMPASKVNFDDSDSSGTPSALSDNETKMFVKDEPNNVPTSSTADEHTTVTKKKIRLTEKKLNF